MVVIDPDDADLQKADGVSQVRWPALQELLAHIALIERW
jgi:hypothetical protein